jgi:hypothetical protein
MCFELGFANLAIRGKARYKRSYLLAKLSKSGGTWMRHRFLPFPCLKTRPKRNGVRRVNASCPPMPPHRVSEWKGLPFFRLQKYSVITLGLPAFDGSIKILTAAYC